MADVNRFPVILKSWGVVLLSNLKAIKFIYFLSKRKFDVFFLKPAV